MNVLTGKLILITLSAGIFAENAKDKKWRSECIKTLQKFGHFNLLWNKTEAFMHAYTNLVIPSSYETEVCRTKEAIVYDYQRDLIKSFLAAHEDHLSEMFAGPLEWCKNNFHLYGYRTRKIRSAENKSSNKKIRTTLEVEQKCEDIMNGNKLRGVTEWPRDKILHALFIRLHINYSIQLLKVMQKNYMEYVGNRIIKFIIYSDAKSPSEFCNKKQSPAFEHPVDQYGNPIYNPDLIESIHVPINPENLKISLSVGECVEQFTSNKHFDINWNKTEAFMHIFYNLTLPKNRSYRDKVYIFDYQQEIFEKFIEKHRRNLHEMFETPLNWCNRIQLNSDDINSAKFFSFKDCSHEEALKIMFEKMSIGSRRFNVNDIQFHYIKYVGTLIEQYVESTSGRSPIEYCYGQQSSAFPIYLEENVIIESFASSSGADKGKRPYIDLNQLPLSDQDE